MAADLYLAFRKRPQGAGGRPSMEEWMDGLLEVAGVLAAREYAVNVLIGERPPASYRELVFCQIDAADFDADAALAALGIDGVDGNRERPDGVRFASWRASSVGVRDDFELVDHLYLQFSANPPSMSFAQYSDWYQEHQDDNIAQTDTLRRGWRYRLQPHVIAADPGPAHLALYEIEGAIEKVRSDLGAAMEAGVISLPGWFTRFASLEGVAAGERAPGR